MFGKAAVLVLALLLPSCATMKGDLPGVIGGAKGTIDWCLIVDVAVIEEMGVCIKGVRTTKET